MSFKLISIVTLVTLTILFIIQNAAVVEIQFLFWSIQVSRVVFMFILLAVGIIIGWFLHSHFSYRRS